MGFSGLIRRVSLVCEHRFVVGVVDLVVCADSKIDFVGYVVLAAAAAAAEDNLEEDGKEMRAMY